MTDRQFVRQYYPEATLDYVVKTHLDSPDITYYNVLTHDYFNPKKEILAQGGYREQAWSRAKKGIKESKRNTTTRGMLLNNH